MGFLLLPFLRTVSIGGGGGMRDKGESNTVTGEALLSGTLVSPLGTSRGLDRDRCLLWDDVWGEEGTVDGIASESRLRAEVRGESWVG